MEATMDKSLVLRLQVERVKQDPIPIKTLQTKADRPRSCDPVVDDRRASSPPAFASLGSG